MMRVPETMEGRRRASLSQQGAWASSRAAADHAGLVPPGPGAETLDSASRACEIVVVPMGSPRMPRTRLLLWIPMVGLAVMLSALAAADPYKPHDPPQLWPDAGNASGWAADPQPLRTSRQWILTFRYRAGKVEFVGARPVQLAQPVTTARRIGRYAVELMSGPALVDRVRFDFPLLGADELAGQSRRPYNDPPRFEVKAVVTYQVMVPDSPRVSRARLVDRATSRVTMLPWPPAAEGAVDGGVDGAVDAALDHGSPDEGADSSTPVDARPAPDGWPVPIPRKADAGPYPRDGGRTDVSR